MSGPPYMPMHVADYLADTPPISRVNWEHHGIYMLALMIGWTMPHCRLPNDPAWLAMRFGCTVAEYHEHIEPILRAYFKCDGNFFKQKRLQRERKYVERKSKIQSERRKGKKKQETGDNRGSSPVKPGSASGGTPHLTSLSREDTSQGREDSQGVELRGPRLVTPSDGVPS